MIVAPQAFLLSESVSPALINPRILWRNRLANLLAAAVTVSSETDDGPSDALTRPNTDEYWEPAALPAWVVFDMGQAYTIDGVGIAGHNLGTCQTAVKVEIGSDPTFATDATFSEELVPNDDSALLFLDDAVVARYVRIGLTGSVVPKIAVASAGDVLAMEKAVSGPYRPISMARKTIGSARKSRGGQFLGQSMRSHGLESEAKFRNLSSDWVRTYFEPFSKHARSLPYFFAWNPSTLPREVGYVWQADGDEDITPVHNGTGLNMDVEWRMFGLGHE